MRFPSRGLFGSSSHTHPRQRRGAQQFIERGLFNQRGQHHQRHSAAGATALLGAVAVLAAGCAAGPEEEGTNPGAGNGEETVSAPGASDKNSAATGADSTTPAAPTDQHAQIAQLLMPGVENYEDARAKLAAGVGGIFITSWADPELLTQPGRDINALREEFDRPFDVALDFEGGRVQRFSEILGDFPAPRAMAEGTAEDVEAYGRQIGTTLHDHGVTVDFAPVIDVDGGGLEVVGDRSFSTDPQRAGELGAAFARGVESAGVRPVFKHFPGHGRASGDTHQGDAVTPPLEEMRNFDLLPYNTALPAVPGAGVMVGHMVVPGLGDDHLPASLNPQAYRLLRDDYGFSGVAYTDDLSGMEAISANYSAGEATARAIAAGADVVLSSTPVDVEEVIAAVDKAVEDGTVSRDHLAEAAARVGAGIDK